MKALLKAMKAPVKTLFENRFRADAGFLLSTTLLIQTFLGLQAGIVKADETEKDQSIYQMEPIVITACWY